MGAKDGPGTSKPPCGSDCGDYCAQVTRDDIDRPHLQAPTKIAYRTDPGGYTVDKQGTTPCECGAAASGGGPSLAGTSGAAGIAPFIGPTSVFALAMGQPNITRLTERLVRAGIVRRPPRHPRCCAGSVGPCMCSYIGPFLARAYRDFIAPWAQFPRQTFNDLNAGLNQINEQFESSILSALYSSAATQQKIAYDKAAGKRKFINQRGGIVERNIRGEQCAPPPQLLAGSYYAPVNGESSSISRTLSAPSSIYQNAMFQATGVRVGNFAAGPQANNADWAQNLYGGGASALVAGAAIDAANAGGVNCRQ